jgi:hypothetical protein
MESELERRNPAGSGRDDGSDCSDFAMCSHLLLINRRLASLTPSATDQRLHENRGFIDEGEFCPSFAGVFLSLANPSSPM